ncbi:hypothetical protein CDAR_266591 [Caerostris darwini]|uniref:Uncharacterized protein n=1 Tax=Caerostris darwini TaxID=1538125 RepID=A0AAV4VWP8_9ARAC|nr:hypothetical protein CDAR_266591 [Caerostris darwini]
MIWRSPGALLASHISHYCNLAAKSGLLKRARYISVINCVVKSGNLHKSRAYLKRRVKTTRGLCKVSFSAERFYLFQLRSADVCEKVGIWKKYCSSIQSDDACAINQHGRAETLNHVLGLCGILHKLSINRTTYLIKHRRSRLVNIDLL